MEKSYFAQKQAAPETACYLLRGVVDDNASVAITAQKCLRRLWLPSERDGVDVERLEHSLSTMSFVVQQYPGLESSLCHFIALDRNATECKSLVPAALRKLERTIDAGADTCSLLRILAVFA